MLDRIAEVSAMLHEEQGNREELQRSELSSSRRRGSVAFCARQCNKRPFIRGTPSSKEGIEKKQATGATRSRGADGLRSAL